MSDHRFVATDEPLPDDLRADDLIGVDTEFMREKTFFAQLCLVQIATRQQIYFIDALVGRAAADFWNELMQKTWVLHSARQDIEVISQSSGQMPKRVFDTQIAAGLLGMPAQLGYANLARELFDVDMAKSHTRANWTRRPFAAGLLDYAAEDVEYLLPARDLLSERLDKLGRLAWAEEDSAAMLAPELYSSDPSQAITRLKGTRNLRGAARVAAERLASWRETLAIKRNRPRQWIARDAVLLELATQRPDSREALQSIDGLPKKLLQRSGDTLLRILADASGQSSAYRPPPPPNEAQKALLKEMQARVAEVAQELNLAPEIIASKKELSSLIVSKQRDSRVMSGWRRQLIGKQLQTLL